MTVNIEILKHDLHVHKMLIEEHKARARRLAVEAAFFKKLWKDFILTHAVTLSITIM